MKRTPFVTEYAVPVLATLLTIIGIFFAIDAGYARSLHSGHGALPSEFYSQVVGWIVGAGIALGIATLNVKRIEKWAMVIWGVIIGLLFLTAFSPLKVVKSGAARWIHFGHIVVQPAEIAKLGLILLLACYVPKLVKMSQLGLQNKSMKVELYGGVGVMLLLILPAFILIEKEPDLGTAGVMAAISIVLMVAGGVRWKTVGLTVGIALFLGFVFVLTQPYRMNRFANHSSQWAASNVDGAGFQQLEAQVSMAYAGARGVGIGEGRAKHVIPAPTTDFVMATVAEETGFFGAAAVLLLLGLLCLRLLVLAQSAESEFASMVLIGIAAWLAVQGCTNLLQANDTLPAIGIPFPFVSSGGSSLAILWIAVGVVQAVLKKAPAEKKEAVAHDRVHRGRNGRAYLSRT